MITATYPTAHNATRKLVVDVVERAQPLRFVVRMRAGDHTFESAPFPERAHAEFARDAVVAWFANTRWHGACTDDPEA